MKTYGNRTLGMATAHNGNDYDLAIVGAGIAGTSLAAAMARAGYGVLLVESATEFRDRVRGEFIFPWGVVEAKALGIYDDILGAGGHRVLWMDMYGGPKRMFHGDLVRDTGAGVSALTFYHPTLQKSLLEAALSAGVTALRGTRVRELERQGGSVRVRTDGTAAEEFRCRMLVGADGRASQTRTLGGFQVQRDPDSNLVAGLLFDDMGVADDAAHHWANPNAGLAAILFPQGRGRVRAYFCHRWDAGYRLSGDKDKDRFIEGFLATGAPEDIFSGVRPAGPLATFDGAHAWVDHPYKDGVALIGDAASTGDPTWGQGLSTSLRDSRLLRDALVSNQDWETAGHSYGAAHDSFYGINHIFEVWTSHLLMDPKSRDLRARVVPKMKLDPFGHLHAFYHGPDRALDEQARIEFFCRDTGRRRSLT